MDWISVKDKLPEDGEYLTYHADKRIIVNRFYQGLWQSLTITHDFETGAKKFLYDATHWMPLPTAPEEE